MSQSIETLQKAMQHAMQNRPKVGGFPYLAEVLRKAGAIRNIWSLPSCQSIFVMTEGNVVIQGNYLTNGFSDIPRFDQEALIRALRIDQAGESTFPEFLAATWKAGVVRYEVDFAKRNVAYYGVVGECYIEEYPAVEVS